MLCNLFGTAKRVALGIGREDVSALREMGKLLAFLKEPEPPKGFKELLSTLPQYKQVLNMPIKRLNKADCQQIVLFIPSADYAMLERRCSTTDYLGIDDN